MTSPKRSHTVSDPLEQEIRDQEVLRANKELAAYFKGKRTEREARAALKTIKAFIRDRERADPANRRPLPVAVRTKESTRHSRHRMASLPDARRQTALSPSRGTVREAGVEDEQRTARVKPD
jgi:hypothetical protein